MTYSFEIKSAESIKYTVQSATDYYPYGKALRSYGKERYQSTYHERDLESGFDYRGARFYDSDVARFNSLDPNASDYASWSDYSYVLCNPVNLIDPDGKDPIDPPKKVGLGRRIIGLAVDFSPLGLAKGVGDAIVGRDIITGEKLSGGERLLGALPGGKFVKAGGTLFTVVKTTDKVGDSVGTANSLNKATDTQKAVSEGDNVYRALRKGEDPSKGLNARSPGKETEIGSHVMGKKESNLISTTKDKEKATGLFNSGNGVVEIDVSKVNGKVIDVSNGHGKGRVYSRTKSHKEVLIKDNGNNVPIPSEAIKWVEKPKK